MCVCVCGVWTHLAAFLDTFPLPLFYLLFCCFLLHRLVCVCVSVGTVDRQQRLSVNGSLCGRSSVDSGGADRSVTTLSSSCPFSSSPSRFYFHLEIRPCSFTIQTLVDSTSFVCPPPLNSLGNQLAPRFFSFFFLFSKKDARTLRRNFSGEVRTNTGASIILKRTRRERNGQLLVPSLSFF